MDFQTLTLEIGADRVATVTINRPRAMNSFNVAMLAEFAALWPRLQADDAVNAVVLRAAEGRAFSTGADVKEALANPIVDYRKPFEQVDPGDHLGPKSRRCWKPIVTAVHGLCAGGAFYWVNESDIVICSAEAEFFDSHVTYGLVAAVEPVGLAQRIPYGEVMRMSLLGNDERVGAQTALRIGLVSEVLADPPAAWARAHQLAARIAAKPAMATQGTVRAVWEAHHLNRRAALVAAMNYPLLGNELGTAQVDRDALMAAAKQYEVR